MCHVFPCVMQKTTFPSRNTPIDKRNLFLLSGRVVSHFRHESLQKKQVPTNRKNNSQILIICENKILKAELYKSNFVTKITECNYLFIFQNSPHFLVNLFVILVSFHISLFALNSVFLLQISSSITFTYVFSVRVKPMQNVIIKKRKNSWLEILLHLRKHGFLIFVRLDLVVLDNADQSKILILNPAEFVIMTNRQNLV